MKPHHPMRDLDVLVYHCPEAPPRRAYVAFFSDDRLPMCFWASEYRKARDAAVRFRDEAVERNEATYLARMERMRKSRARKKGKAHPTKAEA